MGRASQVLVRKFSLNFINKLFVVFYLPQLEGPESTRQEAEEGVEPQTDQEEPHPTPPPTESRVYCGESENTAMVDPLEVIATPDHGEERARDTEIDSIYAHALAE